MKKIRIISLILLSYVQISCAQTNQEKTGIHAFDDRFDTFKKIDRLENRVVVPGDPLIDYKIVEKSVPRYRRLGLQHLAVNRFKGHICVYPTFTSFSRVLCYDENLNLVEEWGAYGQGPAEFRELADLNFDRNGNILALTTLRDTKLKLLDPGLSLILERDDFSGFLSTTEFANNNTFIFHNPDSTDFLLAEYDYSGEKIKEFGKKFIPAIPEEISNKEGFNFFRAARVYNKLITASDDDGNVYCGFIEIPALLKFNRSFQQTDAVDFGDVPAIVAGLANRMNSTNERLSRWLLRSITVDDSYVYLLPEVSYPHRIVVLDKNNFSFVKYIQIQNERGEEEISLTGIEANFLKDYLFITGNYTIARVKK